MSKNVEQQLKHNDCGIAAAKIICNIHQIPLSREFIADNIYLNESGSSLQDIKKFFDQQQFETELQLLDANTIKFNPQKLKSYLPCIMPLQHKQGQHYVVISGVKGKKIQVLDPASGQAYSWTWSELAGKAYTGTANYDPVSSRRLFQQAIKEELQAYEIGPEQIEGTDEAELMNKLTYFTYLKEHFGFSSQKAEKAFLEDLLFNQQLGMLPRQFKSLKFSRDKLRIIAPVVLTITLASATKQQEAHLPPAPIRPVSGYRRLVTEMKDYHKLWGVYIATAVFAAFIGQFTIFTSQVLVDKILPGGNLNLLMLFALGYSVFKMFDLGLSLYKGFIAVRLANIFDHYFLTSFIQKLNSLSIRYIHTFSRGDLTERVKDSLRLKTFFVRFFTHILIDGFIAIYSLVVLFILNWKISLIVVAILILFAIWFRIITPYIRENEQRRFLEKSSLFSALFENIDGLQVIRSFRLETLFTQRLAPRVRSMLQIQKRVRYVSLVNGAVVNTIIIGASILIIVLLSRNAILYHSITAGQIITFTVLTRQIFSSISGLLEENLDLQENEIILNRYFGFSQSAESERSQQVSNPIRSFTLDKIEFIDLGFHYIPQKPVLEKLNFTINKGDKIRLEGSNGAGKSTFCKVLSLLYPPEAGDILINGDKYQFYHKAALRKKILLVSNEDLLFNDTLGYNITFSTQSDISEILELAREIGLYDFIAEKPEGLDFIINEQAKNLSTGQRKKVLIMRALMSEAELIILDETLSGIDRESKQKIERYINQLKDRSFIMISHEPVELIDFTQVVRMKDGALMPCFDQEQYGYKLKTISTAAS